MSVANALPGGRAPRRRSFWTAVVLAVLVVVAGVVVAVRAWLPTGGPEGAVRGYFDALADGDAATALGYGTVPAGPRTLLTGPVLREQQRIAPIDDIGVRRVQAAGDRARVTVHYTLGFAGKSREVDAVVAVTRRGGDWRLDRVAVPTQLLVAQAAQRATILGAAVPDGTTLVFPGAVPLSFDTSYLRIAPDRGSVSLDAGTSTQVTVEVAPAGRTAVLAAVRSAVTSCLTTSRDPRCPLPTERYVPGSVRGVLTDDLSKLDVEVAGSDAGDLEVTGDVDVRGRFQRLEFDDRLTTKADTMFTLPVAAHAYAVAPLTLRWDRPT